MHRRGRVNFCLTCLVMLIVGLAFAGALRTVCWGCMVQGLLPLVQGLLPPVVSRPCRRIAKGRPAAAHAVQRSPFSSSEALGIPAEPFASARMPAAMYVFIKVTRLAGYRAPVPVPAAAPVPAAGELGPPEAVPVYEEHYAEL